MPDALDFAGKVALVTGSSRGIGAEMIKAFGKHGAQCVANYVADAQGQNKTDADLSADPRDGGPHRGPLAPVARPEEEHEAVRRRVRDRGAQLLEHGARSVGRAVVDDDD